MMKDMFGGSQLSVGLSALLLLGLIVNVALRCTPDYAGIESAFQA